jgi:ATP-binding protein involved in chromosome partitioning
MTEPAPGEAEIRASLDAISLPAGEGPLGRSPRLGDIALRSGTLSASIRIAPEEAAAFEPVRRKAEAALARLNGVSRALVALTASREAPGDRAPSPPVRDPSSGAPPRLQPSPAPVRPLAEVSHVIAVASGKGGVGKSTTACNLAIALRALGLRVGLLDADIYGPSAPRLFGLHGRPRLREGRLLEPMDGYGVRVMSIGFVVDEEAAMIWRGPMVQSAITQLVREVAWGRLDILIVDMPPGTGDAQLAIAQGTDLAGAVIVSTPQDLALIDARRGITMFARIDVPILGLVENMGVFVCPTCGSRHPLFGAGGAQAEAERLGVPFLGSVPLSLALREASDAGRPVAACEPESETGRLYGAMARAIWSRLSAG